MKKEKYEYINNDILLKWLKEWDKNKPMPDNIAKAIMMICDQLTHSGKFVGYTWRDEMYGDAILACVKGAKNFDPTKSENPFSFFTTVAFNACRRRINIEHGRLATHENYKHSLETIYDIDSIDDDYGYIDNSIKNYDLNYTKEYVHPSERKKKQKKNNKYDEIFE